MRPNCKSACLSSSILMIYIQYNCAAPVVISKAIISRFVPSSLFLLCLSLCNSLSLCLLVMRYQQNVPYIIYISLQAQTIQSSPFLLVSLIVYIKYFYQNSDAENPSINIYFFLSHHLTFIHLIKFQHQSNMI